MTKQQQQQKKSYVCYDSEWVFTVPTIKNANSLTYTTYILGYLVSNSGTLLEKLFLSQHVCYTVTVQLVYL